MNGRATFSLVGVGLIAGFMTACGGSDGGDDPGGSGAAAGVGGGAASSGAGGGGAGTGGAGAGGAAGGAGGGSAGSAVGGSGGSAGSGATGGNPGIVTNTCKTPSAAINAKLAAHRQSGVAPLAVRFDGLATTHTNSAVNTLRGMHYEFDFGDQDCTTGPTWPHSGKPVGCEEGGPISGHVYEQPGTYTVTLTAWRGTECGTATTKVTVDDPNTVFQGKTVCLSKSGNFTGCPSGAQQVQPASSASFNGAVSAQIGSGARRILLARGETWTSTNQLGMNASGPGHLGAFGTGPAPLIKSASTANYPQIIRTNVDWRVSDLEFEGTDPYNNDTAFGVGSNTLIYRVRVTKTKICASSMKGTSNLALVDVECVDARSSNPALKLGGGNSAYLQRSGILFMGNTFDRGGVTEHLLRIPEGGWCNHADMAWLPDKDNPSWKPYCSDTNVACYRFRKHCSEPP